MTECRYCKVPISARKVYCLDCEQVVAQEKVRAQGYVKRAISAGKLLRPASCKCACCGEQAIGYGHYDYGLPLDVFPVCRSCNRIRKKPAQIDAKVVQYVAPLKREKEKPSGVVSLTKIRKAYCQKCEKNVAVNGRICLECGTLCAIKVADPVDARKRMDKWVKDAAERVIISKERYAAYKRKMAEISKKFEQKP